MLVKLRATLEQHLTSLTEAGQIENLRSCLKSILELIKEQKPHDGSDLASLSEYQAGVSFSGVVKVLMVILALVLRKLPGEKNGILEILEFLSETCKNNPLAIS